MPSNLENQLAEALRKLVDGIEEQRKRNNDAHPVSVYVRMKIKEAEYALAEYDRMNQPRQDY